MDAHCPMHPEKAQGPLPTESVVHEDIPEFFQCVLNCIALGLCSYSIQGPLEALSILCFPRFHAFTTLGHCDLPGFPIKYLGASSQNILIEPPPLAPPGVDDGTNSTRRTSTREDGSTGWNQGDQAKRFQERNRDSLARLMTSLTMHSLSYASTYG